MAALTLHRRAARLSRAQLLWVTSTQSFTHLISMFKETFFGNGININSTAVRSMLVNPLRGTASVCFHDQNMYVYTNVSRRACLKFVMDPARSLGKFVNNVLKQQRVKSYAI